MTSVFRPTRSVELFAQQPGWHLIVVGDKKTPSSWYYPGVTYLSVEQQERLGWKICKQLPYNHYARKNIGYLYAIRHGADLIADVDDDSIPYSWWSAQSDSAETCPFLARVTRPKFANVYRIFSPAFVWPRGFPLSFIRSNDSMQLEPPQPCPVGVWQFLADKDPDVDAIYRLIFNEEIVFQVREPIALARGVYAPFNSQNTVWHKAAFPFLLLPASVTFRFTDILRGYIAQRCMWTLGLHLAFGSATVFQERNPHNFLSDFESEIPAYLKVESLVDVLDSLPDLSDPGQLLLTCYRALRKHRVVQPEDIDLCHAWLQDLASVGVSGK